MELVGARKKAEETEGKGEGREMTGYQIKLEEQTSSKEKGADTGGSCALLQRKSQAQR